MKTKLFALLIILLPFISFAQWQWAKHVGSAVFDYGKIALDANDNTYLTGCHMGFMCYFDTDTFTFFGGNMFLVKYDGSGNEVFAKQIHGLTGTSPNIVIDKSAGVIYISGTYSGTFYVDDAHTDSIVSPDLNVFLAKLDLSGNISWLKEIDADGNDECRALALDANGNIFIAGTVADSGSIDSFSFPKGQFAAGFDDNGNCTNAQNITTGLYLASIFVNNTGVYISGGTNNDTIFINSNLITCNNGQAIFLKYDSNFSFQWYKKAASASGAASCIADNSGNLFACGSYGDSLKIDNITVYDIGNQDIFVLKLDANGNPIWIRNASIIPPTSGGGRADDIKFLSDGNFYITGTFPGSATFGSYTVTAFSGANNSDILIARYDTSGTFIGLDHTANGWGVSLGVNSSDEPIICAEMTGAVSIASNNYTLHGTGNYWDILVIKHGVITGGIGGEDRVAQNQLIIYANPNKGTFNIKVPDEVKTFKKAMLIIYDNTGRETARFSLDNESDTPRFDVTNAAKGMYTVKLMQGDKSYTGKLIVE